MIPSAAAPHSTASICKTIGVRTGRYFRSAPRDMHQPLCQRPDVPRIHSLRLDTMIIDSLLSKLHASFPNYASFDPGSVDDRSGRLAVTVMSQACMRKAETESRPTTGNSCWGVDRNRDGSSNVATGSCVTLAAQCR